MPALEASQLRLRFVSLERLLVHEETDPFRVRRLSRALAADGKLRNPPIVAECDERYIVLDGATRTAVLRELGFRDALVQVVDIKGPAVDLRTWHHVVAGLSLNRFLTYLNELPDLRIKAVGGAAGEDLLSRRDIVARIILCDDREYGLLCPGDAPDCQADLLCQLVAIYRGRAEVHRTTNLSLAVQIEQYPNLTALIAFPRFEPAEIIRIALSGSRVPMGITRHIIAGRALGLDVPLSRLSEDQPLEAKNAWLTDLVRQRLQANKIRLYEEPVFVFDD